MTAALAYQREECPNLRACNDNAQLPSSTVINLSTADRRGLNNHNVAAHAAAPFSLSFVPPMNDLAMERLRSPCQPLKAYDALGRPKETLFADPATPDIWRDYDTNGNITKLYRGEYTTNEVLWDYTYDSYNRIKTEDLTIGGAPYGFDIDYSYNAFGYLYGKRLPSGKYISYTNDGLGRNTKLRSGTAIYAQNASYHPSGAIDSLTYGNGQIFTQTLNERLQPQALLVSDGTIAALDLYYDYDSNGRVQHQTNHLNAADTRDYYYDGAGRLKRADAGAWGQADYTYDALGNIRSKSFSNWNGAGRTVTNNYDSKNRLTASNDNGTSRTVDYDYRGNVTTLGNLTFLYDKTDQPTVVSSGVNGNYVYDGNMKRVKAVMDGHVIYNVYDSTGRLVHVDEADDPATPEFDPKETDYLHGMGQTLARIENDVFTYLHPDHLGSPQAGTKGQGNPLAQYGDVAWNEHYTPFGEALINDTANDNQGGFTGHIKDKATGLNYMQARYYDPKIGRFLSVDPVTFMSTGNPAMFNRYGYCYNDPTNCIDPNGEQGVQFEIEAALPIGTSGLVYEVSFALMGDTSTKEFGGKVAGGLGYGLAAKGDVTVGYFDNSIQSSTGLSTEVNVNIPVTPALIGPAIDASVAGSPNGGTGPIDNALQNNGVNLPIDVQSAEIGVGIGGGAYVAETAGVALTNKGLYIGGQDVTQQGKAVADKAMDSLKSLVRRDDE